MSNSLCAYPWRAAAIRPNGLTIPCCRYPHINHKDMFIQNGDPRTSQHWNSLRQAMLNGEYIENCNGCYSQENNGIRSMRQNSLNKFVPATTNYLKDDPLTSWSFAKEQIIAISQERRLNYVEMLSSLQPLLSQH